MTAAALVRLATSRPNDVTGLLGVPHHLREGVLAVVGKTEGNGCVNDFSRALAANAWEAAFQQSVVTIMSGGTEGVLSPHVTLIGHGQDDSDAELGGLAVGTAVSALVSPASLGRSAQVEAVAEAVAGACIAGGFSGTDAELVLVKCPLLSSDDVANSREPLIATDPYESMGHSRAASALGVGLAVGELDLSDVRAALGGDRDVWSAVASTSSGAEVGACHVVALGHSSTVRSRLHAAHTTMSDAIDAAPVLALLERVAAAGGRLVQLFAKAEASPTGTVRGRRHTMLTDSDINSTRHARAAVGGLLAGLVGETAIYVSGGAEHQGPPGGGPVTIVWEAP